jgi:hypothetical protein
MQKTWSPTCMCSLFHWWIIIAHARGSLREEWSEPGLNCVIWYVLNEMLFVLSGAYSHAQETFLTGQNDRDYSALLPWHPLNDISRYVMWYSPSITASRLPCAPQTWQDRPFGHEKPFINLAKKKMSLTVGFILGKQGWTLFQGSLLLVLIRGIEGTLTSPAQTFSELETQSKASWPHP